MNRKFAFAILLLTASGCGILEEDITTKQVRIIAPADKVTIAPGAVDFRWEQTQYATGYAFTLVSPSFAAAGRIIADTVIYADTLDRRFGVRATLPAGEYEWSVEAFNGGYTTRPAIRSLRVVQTETPEP